MSMAFGPGSGLIYDAIMSELPGNEFVLRQLRDLVASGRAIAFVGAGASAGLYPLWTGLIHKLANEAVDRGLATEADRAFWFNTDFRGAAS